MWNWQRNDWPNFSYDSAVLEEFEAKFLEKAGENLGAFKHVSEEEKTQLRIDWISEEALKTSEIEGEFLNRQSIQSSICNQFGLKTDNHRIPPAEQGIAEMMVDLYENFNEALDHDTLWSWHKMLINTRRDIQAIGSYRTHKEPMQVVSGALHAPKVHFEAPPSKIVGRQMDAFIEWFTTSSLPALTRAGIAHLYFVCIHPFEDGNGRIGRAISEKSLAQSLGRPTLIMLSYTIEQGRKNYYQNLEQSNKHNEITQWLVYFAEMVLEAQDNTRKRIEFVIGKKKLYDRLQTLLNPRQEKLLARMFRENIEGFKGGLSVKNYINITKAPRTTATRDLQDLVEKGALVKTGQLRYTRYYLNIPSFD